MKVINCILGLFSILGAVYCIFYPGITFLNSGWIVSVLLGVWGICAIFNYASNRKKDSKSKSEAALGTVGLICGIAAAVMSVLAIFIPSIDLMLDMIILYMFSFWLIFSGITSIISAWQKTAIVGPTGAGKTTLVNLIMRFYDVRSGAIKIDGIDIRDMQRSRLREIFGMVLQDTWLYNGTIRENIRYGKLNATDEGVEEAAKKVRADAFIRTLPGGYDFVLQEGAGNIAQGQCQLLSIARAMLNNPPILILDEATSSVDVDTRTEVLIQEAMEEMMKGRTSFVIAHRLSTIKDSDNILYMQDGDILEVGNHQTLMEKNGLYAKLYNSRFADNNG